MNRVVYSRGRNTGRLYQYKKDLVSKLVPKYLLVIGTSYWPFVGRNAYAFY